MSRLHQTLVEMLRGAPRLALLLLEAAGAPIPAQATVASVGEQLSPVVDDYRPDSVHVIRDPSTRAEARVLVVEVQLRADEGKTFSLPVYQALARARYRAPCDVLVIATRASVAGRYRRPIELGSGSVFRALVVGPAELARLRSHSLRAELAFLHAIAGGADDPALVLRVARVFDDLMPEERAALYFDVILEVLPASTRRRLEILMQKAHLEFRSDFMRGLVKKGLQKGRTEGLRAAVRAVLAARDTAISEKGKRTLAACDDLEMLEAWARRAARAKTARDVFERTARSTSSDRSRRSAATKSPRPSKRKARRSPAKTRATTRPR